ncbi:MAG: SdpI family protein [Cyclobacteriaceae bacterium]|nr:SdpI family protein [Cyclobacteriaceae bacterium]
MYTALLAHLLIGPLMLILGYVYYRFPPKKINHLYGYRTPRSMRSLGAWDCGNQYSAKALLVVSGLTCLAQIIFYTLIGGESSILWSASFLVVGLVGVIPLTEIHLKKNGF